MTPVSLSPWSLTKEVLRGAEARQRRPGAEVRRRKKQPASGSSKQPSCLDRGKSVAEALLVL